ncbi:MAG: hypothetical protein ABL904_06800, partial [Hyphomicrobiaceae bacterium]
RIRLPAKAVLANAARHQGERAAGAVRRIGFRFDDAADARNGLGGGVLFLERIANPGEFYSLNQFVLMGWTYKNK